MKITGIILAVSLLSGVSFWKLFPREAEYNYTYIEVQKKDFQYLEQEMKAVTIGNRIVKLELK